MKKTTGFLSGLLGVALLLSSSISYADNGAFGGPQSCPTITVTISNQSNVRCNGGNNGLAIVSAAGGAAPYTYIWSNGTVGVRDSNLVAGSYTVTAKDINGCTGTGIITITQPALLSATLTGTAAAACNQSNGAATIVPAGGTSPYVYNWSPSGATTAAVTNLAAGSSTYMVTDANGCTYSNVKLTNNSGRTAAITSQVNVSCFGGSNGSAVVTSSGGATPYKYSWSPIGGNGSTGTNFGVGTYTVTVTDTNGCKALTKVTITQPAVALSATLTGTAAAACNQSNGAATIVPAGGTSPYVYNWSPSGATTAAVTNLAAGSSTYMVTDANGCTYSNVKLTNNSGRTAAITSQVNVSCFGGSNGSAVVTSSGGATPYKYSWSPIGGNGSTGTNFGVGTYTVTVTDTNGCKALVKATITQPATQVIAMITSSTNASTSCVSNGTATGAASGGTPPYTYLWSPSGGSTTAVGGLSAGTYAFTAKDANGCNATATVAISHGGISLTTTTGAAHCSNNGSITVHATGGAGNYQYNWNPAVSASASAFNLAPGTYTITVKDSNNCPNVIVTTVGQTGITATTTAVPAHCGNNGSVTVTANGGAGVYTYTWSPNVGNTATVHNLAPGTYSITVKDSNNCSDVVFATVSQTAGVTLTINSTSTHCGLNNGTATVTASGGTSPYTFSWNTGATTSTINAISGGFYTVAVHDNSTCSATDSTLVTGSSPIGVTVSTTNATSGNNGTATAHVTNGTAPYTYSWSPTSGSGDSLGSLAAGTYSVNVTDHNGCSGGASGTVNGPAKAFTICYVTVDSSVNSNMVVWDSAGSFNGGVDSVQIYKKTTTQYQLIGKASAYGQSYIDFTSSPLKESSFYEIASFHNNTKIGATSPYHQTMLLQANMGIGNVVNLSWNDYVGDTVSYYVIMRSSGAAFSKYDSVPSGSTSYTDLTPGGTTQYMITAVWSNLACAQTTNSYSNRKAIIVTGINQLSSSSTVEVYPSPATDVVSIATHENIDGVLSITNVFGQEVFADKITGTGNSVKQIGIGNLPQGVYMLKITADGKETVKKIIKL